MNGDKKYCAECGKSARIGDDETYIVCQNPDCAIEGDMVKLPKPSESDKILDKGK